MYDKLFSKKEKAHKDLKEMMARVTKHLTKGGTGTGKEIGTKTEPAVSKKLEVKCREELMKKLQMEVQSGLPEMDLTPWPEVK